MRRFVISISSWFPSVSSDCSEIQQLVTLPYNLLLHKTSREVLGIDLRGHVIIVDEAHSEHLFFPQVP